MKQTAWNVINGFAFWIKTSNKMTNCNTYSTPPPPSPLSPTNPKCSVFSFEAVLSGHYNSLIKTHYRNILILHVLCLFCKICSISSAIVRLIVWERETIQTANVFCIVQESGILVSPLLPSWFTFSVTEGSGIVFTSPLPLESRGTAFNLVWFTLSSPSTSSVLPFPSSFSCIWIKGFYSLYTLKPALKNYTFSSAGKHV